MSKIDTLAAIDPAAAANLNMLFADQGLQDAEQATDYVLHVATALRSGIPLIQWLTSRCTECGDIPVRTEDMYHVVISGHVVIGCEGYWVVNPAAVGVDAPNWQDWTVTA